MGDNGDLKTRETDGTVFDVRRLLSALWRHALFILSCALVGSVLLAAKEAYTNKPKYKSSFSVYVVNKTADQEVSSLSTADVTASNQAASSYASEIKSNQLFIDRVIEQAGLTGVYDYNAVRNAISTAHENNSQKVDITVTLNKSEDCVRLTRALAVMIPSVLPEVVRGTSVRVTSNPLQSASRTVANVKGSAKKGFLFGLIPAVFLVLLLELLDGRVKSTQELAAIAGGKKLSVIPSARGKSVILGDESDDRYKEAWFSLRTGLLAGKEGESSVIGVTSCSDSEGKTTTALNLAIAYSEIGKNVLLVDANLRNSSCADLLGAENAPGLCEVMSGTAEIRDAVRAGIRPGISFLPPGVPTGEPANIIGSGKMKTVFSLLREQFDVIVVDLPAAERYSDAVSAGGFVDSFLFVVRKSCSDSRKIRSAVEKLEDAGGRIAVFVYNDAGAK